VTIGRSLKCHSCRRRTRTRPPNLVVNLLDDRFECCCLEGGIVQVPIHNLLILIHAVDHQPFDLGFHCELKVVEGIGEGALDDFGVLLCFLDELVEEELVRLGELGAEAVVEHFDDLREGDIFVFGLACADVGEGFEAHVVADLEDELALVELVDAACRPWSG